MKFLSDIASFQFKAYYNSLSSEDLRKVCQRFDIQSSLAKADMVDALADYLIQSHLNEVASLGIFPELNKAKAFFDKSNDLVWIDIYADL